MTDTLQNIVIFTSPELGYGRGVIRGVFAFRDQNRLPWLLRVCHVREHDDQRALIESLEPDGVIAADAQLQGSLVSVPAVQLLFIHMPVDGPFLDLDDFAVGVMAAEHLMERGFRSMAMVRRWSHLAVPPREAGFKKALAEFGIKPSIHVAGNAGGFYDGSERAAVDRRWLLSLPRPLGLFAETDAIGHSLAEHCRLAGMRVPEEVSIIGVDNDQLVCELTHPPLSSIAIPWETLGHEGARLLSHLMTTGERIDSPLLRPRGVVTRQSSDTLAIEDQDVVHAVRFIGANAHRGIDVQDVAAEVAISRRSLELRFRNAVGRSLFQEIVRMRIRRACDDLANTDLPLPAVAKRAGFPSGSKLSAVFRRETGQTPSEYRRSRNAIRTS